MFVPSSTAPSVFHILTTAFTFGPSATDLILLVGVLVDPGVRCAQHGDEEVEHHDRHDHQVRRQEHRRHGVELGAGELVEEVGLSEHGLEHVLPNLCVWGFTKKKKKKKKKTDTYLVKFVFCPPPNFEKIYEW